jgi:hypothetical protein
LQEADNEWQQHALCSNLDGEMSFLEYWTVVFKEKNQVGEKINPNLTKLVATVLSLPFSNAAVERALLKYACMLHTYCIHATCMQWNIHTCPHACRGMHMYADDSCMHANHVKHTCMHANHLCIHANYT